MRKFHSLLGRRRGKTTDYASGGNPDATTRRNTGNSGHIGRNDLENHFKHDDGVFPGISLTFHEDKTVTTDSPDFTVGLTYEAKGNTLKIVWLWGGAYNEYMEGPLTIEGNTATYTFNWFNMDGSCNTIDDPRTLTLQKQ